MYGVWDDVTVFVSRCILGNILVFCQIVQPQVKNISVFRELGLDIVLIFVVCEQTRNGEKCGVYIF